MASLPTAQQAGADHLPALTSLRFIAAFAVLVLHYRDLLGPMPQWLLRGIVGGQYGVTFFFILSGFILIYRYHGWFAEGVSEGPFFRFQRYRFARIYPVYLLGLLLDTPWHLLERAHAGQLAEVGGTWWASDIAQAGGRGTSSRAMVYQVLMPFSVGSLAQGSSPVLRPRPRPLAAAPFRWRSG